MYMRQERSSQPQGEVLEGRVSHCRVAMWGQWGGLSGSRLPVGAEGQGEGGRGTAPLKGDGLMV